MGIQNWEAKVILQENLILGEAAHWHPELNRLLYVDIDGKKLGLLDPLSGRKQEYQLGNKAGTVVPVNQDQVMVALQGALAIVDLQNKTTNHLITVESDQPENRCNDGKCDALGRLWFGTMHADAKLNKGALYCYDGHLTKMLDQITISNGICWSADNQIMYYIDSIDRHIKAFDFDLVTPAISNPRIVIEIGQQGCLPDGMCIDEQDMLWVAIWGGCCVNRYDPASGKLIGNVKVNAPQVSSCAFGGKHGTELFITTATKGLSLEVMKKYPESGSVFVVETNIKGAKMNSFNKQYIQHIF